MKVALRFVTADRTGLPIMQRVSMFRVTILMAVAVFPGVLFAQERSLPIIDMHLHANRADDNGPPPTYLCPGFENYGLDPKQPADALTKKPPCPNVLVGAATDETLTCVCRGADPCGCRSASGEPSVASKSPSPFLETAPTVGRRGPIRDANPFPSAPGPGCRQLPAGFQVPRE